MCGPSPCMLTAHIAQSRVEVIATQDGIQQFCLEVQGAKGARGLRRDHPSGFQVSGDQGRVRDLGAILALNSSHLPRPCHYPSLRLLHRSKLEWYGKSMLVDLCLYLFNSLRGPRLRASTPDTWELHYRSRLIPPGTETLRHFRDLHG